MDDPSQPSNTARPIEGRRPVRPVAVDVDSVAASTPASAAPGMNVGDIYYILFRHKWKILLCSTVGLLAAGAVYQLKPPPYQSDARLFIRYVMEAKSLAQAGDDGRMKSPDQRGETIINSEMEILTSRDVAEQVAAAVGPEKILAKAGGGKEVNRAAALIGKNLTVEVPARSSVVRISFQHPDLEIVQPVLREVVDRYLKRHVEIHRAAGIVGDFLTQETDQLRSRLAQTEDELRKARNKAGVISLEDSKKTNAEAIARIRQEIFNTQAEQAARAAIFELFAKKPAPTTADAAPEPEPTPDQVNEYRNAVSRFMLLQKREQELLAYFKEDNTRVKDVRTQIAEAADAKRKLEEATPRLLRLVTAAPASVPGSTEKPFDQAAEAAQLSALEARIKMLNSQLEAVRAEVAAADQMEGTILELKRKKDLEETNYRYYAASLEQSRINEALGTGTVSNISQIQTPSPPFIDWSKTFKLMGGLAAGGLAAGLVWALLIEFVFDRSVRRPIDVERILHLPLFLSIPRIGKKEIRRLKDAPSAPKSILPPSSAVEGSSETARNGAAIAPTDGGPALHPFHETLRDRLISYFESRDLIHKPKLVAVTGLGRNSGVTTIAAGLAGSLSETGDGNVLLVDMTQGQGSAQQFYKGKAVCGLDELLDTRDNAQIEGNLYVVGEGPGDNKLTRILPQRFNKLVPKLKASNFDYIIFDMPPVSQISITPRLAGFMDMVLLVIESEKTDQELVQRATTLLAESKAHVGAVLNKTRNYVPSKMHQEYLGNI